MKFGMKWLLSALLALAVLAGLNSPVYAATIASIYPTQVSNDVSSTITVTGSEFDLSAVVYLNATPLSTTLVDDKKLTAIVPAGMAPGDYSVTVRINNSDATGGPLTLVVYPPIVVPPTSAPSFSRPQLVIGSYRANVSVVTSGEDFKLNIVFDNAGASDASNVQVSFSSPDLVPTRTGGVIALGGISAGGHASASQTFLALDSVYGKSVVVIDVTLTYYDPAGTAYSDKFSLSLSAG